ncbi:MAG: pyrroline-5-carboxylate reductase [Acidobacteriota bacterium]
MDETQSPKLGRLAVIGAGKMGETLIGALTAAGIVAPEDVVATARHEARLRLVAERYGVTTTTDNRAAVRGAEWILLCVKPQVAPAVLVQIAPELTADQVLVSIIAGLTTTQTEQALARGIEADLTAQPTVPVVRAMPNTPARIGHGMTAICGGRAARAEHLATAEALFARLGRATVLDEKYFDAVTGLSASGPAFIYMVIEALAEGGVKVGLPRKVATELAAQACLGAGHMVVETGDHPALLKDEVTTPAGCTMDGILELEEGGLRVTLIKAVVEARRRAEELVDG